MAILAGEVVSAARLQALQPAQYLAVADTNLALVSAVADVSGATVTFSTVFPNATAVVEWVADFDSVAASAATGVAFINVDGTDQTSPQAIEQQGTSNDRRGGRNQQTSVALASAGSHTIKLRGQKAAGTDSAMQINALHSTIKITVYEQV